MSEQDQTGNHQPGHADLEAQTAVDHAFWQVPGTPFQVIYSLPLFHAIDFVVNEGYRKIPHGGIEVGGLLFGSSEGDTVRIEAFRPIECEHAAGPSINFSEHDLQQLATQLAESASDQGLNHLRPVGWFLAHTRGPLAMTEAEVKHFERFFPEPGCLTVLVKPERFQPTRFGFLVRQADGEMPREAASPAVILPLPGRSHKAGQLVPSLVAPAPVSGTRRTIRETYQELDVEESPLAPAEKPSAPTPLGIWKIPPDAGVGETEAQRGLAHAEQPLDEPRTPAERAARRQLARDRARVIDQAFPHPAPETDYQPPSPPAPRQSVPFRPPPLPSLPANMSPQMQPPYDQDGQAPGYGSGQNAQAASAEESVLNTRSITVLALAAILGCLVGYIAYLQLPAPVIPIDVRTVNQTIVVSWPPDETRNAMYASIRLNDGPPVPLSADEKRAGQVALTAPKDFKVEILARNWVRDSRGIVRYLHSANGNGQILPPVTQQLP
jgi:hypothetical protein